MQKTSTDHQKAAEAGRTDEENRRDYEAMGNFCRGIDTRADRRRIEKRWGVKLTVDTGWRGAEVAYIYDAATNAHLGWLIREEPTYTNTYRAKAANGHEIFARYSNRLHDEIPAIFREQASLDAHYARLNARDRATRLSFH